MTMRVKLEKEMDHLLINECGPCPKNILNARLSVCEGCSVYKKLRSIGDKLDEEVKERRKNKRKQQLKVIKSSRSKIEKERAMKKYILENHINLSVKKMSKELGLSETKMYEFRLELGLVRRRNK